MDLTALVFWLLTASVGGYMFTLHSRIGRPPEQERRSHFPAPVILGHPTLALSGLGFWVAYLNQDQPWMAWTAFGFLLATALFGDVLFFHWFGERRGSEPQYEDGVRVSDLDIPTPAVALHGVLAVTTIVLVLVEALRAS